jgi:hypothetical protein
MNIEQRLQILEDIQAITELKAKYANYADCGWGDRLSNNPDALAGLFVADGVWDCGPFGYAAGRRGILDTFASFTFLKVDFHHFGNPLIKINGDTATGEWHGLFAIVNEQEGTQQWVGARYNNEFVRTAEGWKFKYLKFTPAFISDSPSGFKALFNEA